MYISVPAASHIRILEALYDTYRVSKKDDENFDFPAWVYSTAKCKAIFTYDYPMNFDVTIYDIEQLEFQSYNDYCHFILRWSP